eukprot:SAG11_NODE_35876_length_264_cov_1.193939_1_plen_38_part_10
MPHLIRKRVVAACEALYTVCVDRLERIEWEGINAVVDT